MPENWDNYIEMRNTVKITKEEHWKSFNDEMEADFPGALKRVCKLLSGMKKNTNNTTKNNHAKCGKHILKKCTQNQKIRKICWSSKNHDRAGKHGKETQKEEDATRRQNDNCSTFWFNMEFNTGRVEKYNLSLEREKKPIPPTIVG